LSFTVYLFVKMFMAVNLDRLIYCICNMHQLINVGANANA